MKDPNEVLRQKEEEYENVQIELAVLFKAFLILAEPGDLGYKEVHESLNKG